MSQMLMEGEVWTRVWEQTVTTASALYHFVEEGGGTYTNDVDVCDGASDVPLGVCVDAGNLTAGSSCAIRIKGVTKLELHSTVTTLFTYLGAHTDGSAVTKSSNTNIVRALAMETGVDGDFIEALLVYFIIAT